MQKIFAIATAALFIYGCKKADQDTNYSIDSTTESAQQVGDAMAGVDESGGNTSGSIASLELRSAEKTFARLSQGEASKSEQLALMILPLAHAAACNTVAFNTCSANQKVRNFADCSTAGGGTMSGNVTLSYTGTGSATCTLPMSNDTVSRAPNFSVNGVRGASFAVASISTGQTLTRTGATNFTFSNTGIRRTFVTPKGTTLLDITTSTSSPVSVTGNSRNTRTLSGGTIVVLNNLTSVSCSLTPSSVSWSSACNCPTAGSWSGTCSDATTLSVAFSNTCGESTVTKNGVVSTVTMDRCQQ
jgi:hypothetical protein